MHTVLDEQPPNGSNTEAVQKCNQRPTCWLRLDQRNESFYLEIQDDGRGGSNSEGNGLRGMRGRVEILDGTLTRSTEPGTTLTITLPMKEVVAKKRRLPELNPRGKKRTHDDPSSSGGNGSLEYGRHRPARFAVD
ncbi:MAG TPA: hypothetical protein VGS05_01835 [Candidatus Sulfotelmatobacter sp.]|nr:hypothetical protein [Candidatus Sulfotelmatobacter sp.]